jgi:signal transduction histidine kinase
MTWLRQHLDVSLAGLFFVGFTIELLIRGGDDLERTVPCAVVASGATAWRRTQPIPSYLVTLLGLLALSHQVPGLADDSPVFFVVFLACSYAVGAHTRGREAVLAALFILVETVVFVRFDGDPFYYGDVAFGMFVVGGPWATGLAIRLRRERETALEENTRLAVAEERATIARELHDVVAHAISVTVLQSRGARRQLGQDEAAVRRALDAIEHTNTQALGDMRRLLAILRDTEGDAAPAPQPSLSRLSALVDDVRESGLPVEVITNGDGTDIPPGVDLSAYRIVQEALTNVLKHAGPAVATVRLDYGPDDLRLTISDTGHGPNGSRGGHGLVGIRERVAVVGGEVATGAGDDGGFVVRARLPYSVDA